MRRHPKISMALLVLGAIALTLGVLAAFVRDTLTDSSEFADRAQVAFDDPSVRTAMANEIVDQIVAAEPDLLSVRPLVVSVFEGVLATDPTSNLFRAAVADVHRTMFTNDSDTITIQLADLVLVAKTQITALNPEVGALIPDDLTDGIVAVRTEARTTNFVQLVESLGLLAILLPLFATAAFVVALWEASSTNTALVRLGFAVIVSAIGVTLLASLGRLMLIDSGDEIQVAVWEAFMEPLAAWVLILGGLGAVVSAIAWFGIGETQVGQQFEEIRHLARRRTSKTERVLWGAAVAATGVLFVVETTSILRLAVAVTGAGLFAIGCREILATIAPSLVTGADEEHDQPGADGSADIGKGGPWVVSSLLIGVGALALVAIVQSGESDSSNDAADIGCNGSVLLCDKPFDEVAMAATHNSHAAAQNGFVNGYQDEGMIKQLEDGIRAFLVDVYFGLDTAAGDVDLIVTDRAPITAEEREVLVAEQGESAVVAAEELLVQNTESGGDRDLYLCHALCEIGATRFVDELKGVKDFLDDHPSQVISIIIQDEGPEPADIAEAFEESGLIDLVLVQDLDSPWPTLGEMIDKNTRVFVSAENNPGDLDWYHDAFTFVQDTPFKFESVESFTCELFRGDEDSPLFLVNHWLSPVSPSSADLANAKEVLTDRIAECGQVRGLQPNMIAVDFYDRGDLIDFVNKLNGL